MKSITLDWNKFHDSNIYRKATLQPIKNNKSHKKPILNPSTKISQKNFGGFKDFTSFRALKRVNYIHFIAFSK
jgi:hypothetical protein